MSRCSGSKALREEGRRSQIGGGRLVNCLGSKGEEYNWQDLRRSTVAPKQVFQLSLPRECVSQTSTRSPQEDLLSAV